MIKFEEIILGDFLQPHSSTENTLIEATEPQVDDLGETARDGEAVESRMRMKVQINNISNCSCVIKFKDTETHAPIVTKGEVPTNGYTRVPTKICDYLVMLRDKYTYYPILIEMTKISNNLNLNEKFEQLYCTWPLFEYIRKIYTFTCTGPIHIADPFFALLYEIEATSTFAPPGPLNLVKFHWNKNLITPICGHETPEAVYQYKHRPRDITVVCKQVMPNVKLDLYDIVRGSYRIR